MSDDLEVAQSLFRSWADPKFPGMLCRETRVPCPPEGVASVTLVGQPAIDQVTRESITVTTGLLASLGEYNVARGVLRATNAEGFIEDDVFAMLSQVIDMMEKGGH